MGKYYCKYTFNLSSFKQQWSYVKLCYKSLTFNTIDTFAESAFEPIFCTVQFALQWFGVVFVALVTSLITAVVVLFYTSVIPYILDYYSFIYSCVHLFYGHYLLIMICFHYYNAVTTKSGTPSKGIVGVPVRSICKKCFLSKPPRSHHCNVCKSCQLKMDHHCPWVNNCVGHFNHRYFICFCIFMCLGTFYVSCSSWSLFNDCFHLKRKYDVTKHKLYSMFGYELVGEVMRPSPPNLCATKSVGFHNGIIFLWILCCSVTMSLGCLTLWHMYLISRGETSIERLINKKEKSRLKRLKMQFVNPYNFGFKENWKQLLGICDFRSFFFRVILPSTHLPKENGIIWTSAENYVIEA